MKKYLLLFIAFTFSLFINSANYNKTIQVGETVKVSATINSGTITPNDVDISDDTVVSAYGNLSQQSYGNYFVVNITGLKAGIATVTTGYRNPYNYNQFDSRDTYTITVVDVKSISIPSSLSLTVGSQYTFSPIITDAEAVTTLTWNSSNTSVATITSGGVLSTLGIGTTTITCVASNGVSAQCSVTVNPVYVSEITLNEIELELTSGEKHQLTANVFPNNATNKNVNWSSSNENVAVVDGEGLITAITSGTCQVKAVADDGSGKTASCLVTVEKNNKLTLTEVAECSGGRNTMNVILSDEETVLGFQFDLILPVGVSIPTDDKGELLAQLMGNASSTHSITSSKVNDTQYRFIVTSLSGKSISSSGGDGMTITIDVAEDFAVGKYDITIQDIELTVKRGNDYEDVHPRNNTTTLTITEAIMGDVNGDTRVSVTDVLSIVGYIMENHPYKFIRKV